MPTQETLAIRQWTTDPDYPLPTASRAPSLEDNRSPAYVKRLIAKLNLKPGKHNLIKPLSVALHVIYYIEPTASYS